MRAEPATIETERLKLVALLPEELEAIVMGDFERADQLTGARFPRGWPHHPEARYGLAWHLSALRREATQAEWRMRVMVERSRRAR